MLGWMLFASLRQEFGNRKHSSGKLGGKVITLSLINRNLENIGDRGTVFMQLLFNKLGIIIWTTSAKIFFTFYTFLLFSYQWLAEVNFRYKRMKQTKPLSDIQQKYEAHALFLHYHTTSQNPHSGWGLKCKCPVQLKNTKDHGNMAPCYMHWSKQHKCF